tara:strand:+ start:299 stop:859 length:561 start_codon:yes stop_codon:yes gene_type:complete
MNAKETLKKARTLLGIQVKLEQMKLDNGAVLEAEVFEAGAEIFVVADEERVAVPVGEYTTEDGMSIVIAEEGIISEIKEAGAAEEEAPAAEEVVEEEELATESAKPKKIVKSISEEQFFSEIEKLRNEIKELKLSKVEEVVELSSHSEVESISHNPENSTEKKELHLYAQNAKNTLQNRIFNTINK